MSKTLPTVAKFLEKAIEASGKTQLQIADEMGYDYPNVISSMKSGDTKLPLNKIPACAKALHVDPKHLLDIVMSEYYPETWPTIRAALLQSPVTDDDAALIQLLRDSTRDLNIDLSKPEIVSALADALKPFKKPA
jgi:hypothetical protein